MNYLGINLTKDPKDLKTMTFLKVIEDDSHKWEDIQCSWNGRHNILKILILTKMIYRMKAVPIS